MSISPRHRDSLWQRDNSQSNIKSQYALFLTARLILLTDLSFPAFQRADFSLLFFLPLTDSSLSQVSGYHPAQPSAERHRAVSSEHMVLCFFIPCPKSLLDPDGEVNIVECLILCTCGDYVPFDIRYALVKWVSTAAPLFLWQSRISVHVCRCHTSSHSHTYT